MLITIFFDIVMQTHVYIVALAVSIPQWLSHHTHTEHLVTGRKINHNNKNNINKNTFNIYQSLMTISYHTNNLKSNLSVKFINIEISGRSLNFGHSVIVFLWNLIWQMEWVWVRGTKQKRQGARGRKETLDGLPVWWCSTIEKPRENPGQQHLYQCLHFSKCQ